MKIAVLDDYADAFRKVRAYARLQDHEVVVFHDTERDPAKLVARLKNADALVLTQQRSLLPRTVIEQLPELKLVAQTGGHVEHIDMAACAERGILVAAAGGDNSYSTAELTWGLIIASLRHIPYEIRQLKQGMWQTTIGTQLHGRTLGVYGLGKIGGSVAAVGKAFGMQVTCWGREASKARASDAGYTVPASREAFFAGADIVSLHVHFNAATRGIVTADDLAQMKPSALLVNTGRARLIEEGALLAALDNGRPGFAAVDVYEDEPVVGGSHPLLGLPNVLCTPHLGYAVQEKYESIYRAAIDSILGFASGRPVNVIQRQAKNLGFDRSFAMQSELPAGNPGEQE